MTLPLEEQTNSLQKDPWIVEASSRPVIRSYDPYTDYVWLETLWKKAVHPRWFVTAAALRLTLSNSKLVVVAEQFGKPVGVGAVDYDLFGEAGLVFFLIDPSHQGRGIATFLLQAIESRLKALGIRVLRLGAVSTGTYLWPGIPTELEASWWFFIKNGWLAEESCADLVQELQTFSTPPWVFERIKAAGIVLQLSTPALRSSIVAFERLNFPAWSTFFEEKLCRSERDQEVLIAQTAEGGIVGSVLLETELSSRWSVDTDLHIGSINALGVASEYQRQGIGLALAAKAMELLQERGCAKCYVQWTGLDAWYGNLGTSIWAQYRMAQKSL
ncbi:MAG: GNAT family N-acetyltransferase [Janthinobacterium lividum]